jgi:putative transposase
LNPTQQFSNFFNAYAKAINKAYNRTGGLFQERFGRIPVRSDEYFACLVTYIHRNPQKHGFVDDFRDYPYSSYEAICSAKPTRLKRDQVLEWFSGRDWFLRTHQELVDEKKIAELVEEDV